MHEKAPDALTGWAFRFDNRSMSKPKKGVHSAPKDGESASSAPSGPPAEAAAQDGKAADKGAAGTETPKKKKGSRKASAKSADPGDPAGAAAPEPAKRRGGRPKKSDELRQTEARPEELARAISLLDQLIEAFGGSRRRVDKMLGTGRSRTSQLLTGRLELKFQHILDVLEVLGIETRAFFEVLYGEEAHAPFPAPLAVVYHQKLRAMGVSDAPRLIGPKLPEPPPITEFLTEKEVRRLIDDRLFEAFRHVLPVLKKPAKDANAAESSVLEPKPEPEA